MVEGARSLQRSAIGRSLQSNTSASRRHANYNDRLDIAKNSFLMGSTWPKRSSFGSNCGAAKCWHSSTRCRLPYRHGGLRHGSLLGARTHETSSLCASDAGERCEGLHQTQQERCCRCRGDLRSGATADHAFCAGQIGRAARPVDAASDARSFDAAADSGDQCFAGAYGRARHYACARERRMEMNLSRWPFGARDPWELCKSIDVHRWHREDLLSAGQSFPCSWTSGESGPAPSTCGRFRGFDLSSA